MEAPEATGGQRVIIRHRKKALTNGDNNSFGGSTAQPQAQDKPMQQEETG
jgi:hypothetical protein